MAPARDLNEVLTDIGVGPYQFTQLFLVGGISLTDGAEILVASSLLTALKEAWHLTPLVRGLMMSTVFMGVFIGGLLGGNIGDVFGRRKAILLSYGGLVLFGGMIALAQGPLSMLMLRFVFGMAFGSGVAPAMAMVVESSPSYWRSHFLNISGAGFMFGEVYTSLLLIWFMPTLSDPEGEHWRWVTLFAVVPGFVFFLLSIPLLRESPHYLLSVGRHDEAVQTVQYIAYMNNAVDRVEGLSSQTPDLQLQLPTAGEATPLVESSTAAANVLASATAEGGQRSARSVGVFNQPMGNLAKLRESIEVLSRKEYRGIVIGGAYICFLGNFLFYGLTYALPQVFQHLHHTLAPAYQVLFVSICDIPGVFLVFFLLYAKGISHRTGLTILAACCAVLSLTLISIEHGKAGLWAGLPSAYLIKYGAAAFFSLSYVYLSEVFPASVRSSGIAFCVSAGRIGSMTAPLVVEAMSFKEFTLFGHEVPHAPFLMLTSGLCVLAIIFIKLFLHFELKNAPLQSCEPSAAGAEARKKQELARRLPVDPETPAVAG